MKITAPASGYGRIFVKPRAPNQTPYHRDLYKAISLKSSVLRPLTYEILADACLMAEYKRQSFYQRQAFSVYGRVNVY